MDINLLTEPMLGHWRASTGAGVCEFQFGSRLIYVEHHYDESPLARLIQAQRLVNAAWCDLPQALTFAENLCGKKMPELMRLYKEYVPQKSPLYVYSIHFELDKPYPRYTISKNPEFEWSRMISYKDSMGQEHSVRMEDFEPSDDFWIFINRVGFERFMLEVAEF